MTRFIIWTLLLTVTTCTLECDVDEVVTCACIKSPATTRTRYYTEYFSMYQNSDNIFYQNQSFGLDIALAYQLDPCMVVTNTVQFGSVLASIGLSCGGRWCVGTNFTGCAHRLCYEMDYVIDKTGPEFDPASKIILANVVYVFGIWNAQLSGLAQRDYLSAINEKLIVYGADRLNRIRQQIIDCSLNRTTEIVVTDTNTPVFDTNIVCLKTCSCQSNQALDILCGTDYAECGFDPSLCPLEPVTTTSMVTDVPGQGNTSAIIVCFIILTTCLFIMVLGGWNYYKISRPLHL